MLLRLTDGEGSPMYVNMERVNYFQKRSGDELTVIHFGGTSNPWVQVKENPADIAKMIGGAKGVRPAFRGDPDDDDPPRAITPNF